MMSGDAHLVARGFRRPQQNSDSEPLLVMLDALTLVTATGKKGAVGGLLAEVCLDVGTEKVVDDYDLYDQSEDAVISTRNHLCKSDYDA